ncbi:alpha-mannosidase At3g26720-like isoform X2 [Wolffia australiana]
MAASMSFALLLCLFFLGGFPFADSYYIAYNTTPQIVPDKINVHLVAHSHDDVGWLKTIDQYYVGSNNSIQGACVQNVLDSVVSALLADKNRRFIYVEQAFFQRWWRQQSDAIKKIVRGLVDSGQLEFINGGMCMHDEASTLYIDMIDQTTLGHRFIEHEFGQIPRIGWQIDPFGHSAVQAYLLSSEVGFDALFFSRIDYQDRIKRKGLKSLEVVWRGSQTFGSTSDVFTGIFPENYEPPSGFYYEVNDDSPIIQDDSNLFDYNVEQRVNEFVAAALFQANITRTNHIMWTMGTDFKYQYANSWFRQLDKFIHYVNLDGRVNALYSTPSIYTDAKHATKESWPLKTEDFFPYADRKNAYWTGYFTSRPTFKGYVRAMSGYYLAARQLEFLRGRINSRPTTDTLADALAIAQHHDAVTGTEKQHVADDYSKRLSIGYAEAEELVSSSFACLTESTSSTKCEALSPSFKQCPLLNITYCPLSEMELSEGKDLVVLVYNPLGWNREDIIRIPVSTASVIVRNCKGQFVDSQVLPILNVSQEIRKLHAKAYLGHSAGIDPKFWLAFPVSVPPLGFNTYIISVGGNAGRPVMSKVYESHNNVVVGQGNLKLVFNEGSLSRYVNSRDSINAAMDLSYVYYSGDDGSGTDYQASGAYVFRPNGTYPIEQRKQKSLTIMQGPIVEEVYQEINQWIHQITRLYRGKEHAEIEFIIGPIPVDDNVGKEVATRINSNVRSDRTFYTDSNGRDFIKRVRDYRSDWDLEVNQPIAGNYYPINLGMYLSDNTTEFSVLVDRSVGGSSISDGQIELMLHRRLLHDDGRGVAEALNETLCINKKCSGLIVAGKFYFRIDPFGNGAKWRRSQGQELYSPLLLAFTEQNGDDWAKSRVTTFTAMDASYSLPENVALITLQALEDGSVLLRLAHLYEAGEDKDLSVMARVDLTKLFPDKKIEKIVETNLSANQQRSEMERKRLVWKVASSPDETRPQPPLRGRPVDPLKLVIELGPMEIRTFLVNFSFVSVL